MLAHMGGSFVHHTHGPAHQLSFEDEKGTVQHDFGRSSGKGSRRIVVHTIQSVGRWSCVLSPGFPPRMDAFEPREAVDSFLASVVSPEQRFCARQSQAWTIVPQ